MPTANSGDIVALDDSYGQDNGAGNWTNDGSGTIWFRRHVGTLQYWPAWRFKISGAIRDAVVAGTGVSSATLTVGISHDQSGGNAITGQVYIGPDQGAFSTTVDSLAIRTQFVSDGYTPVPWLFAAGLGFGDQDSPDLSAALDAAITDAVDDGNGDYIVTMVLVDPTGSGNVGNAYRFKCLETSLWATLSYSTLNFDYDAPATNASASPAAATASAEGGVGYWNTQNVNYDRDNSRTGNRFRRYLDIYEPWTVDYDDSAGRRVGVYVHGGAFFEGSEDTISVAHRDYLLRRGYTVIAVRYSLTDLNTSNSPPTEGNDNDYSHPMPVQDLGMALTWLTDSDGGNTPAGKPAELQAALDPDFITLQGYSAGAHIALEYALVYDDQRTHQWAYTNPDGSVTRRAAEPSSSPDFVYTQGRTVQPRPRGVFMWDGPTSITLTVAYNGNMFVAHRAYAGGNTDPTGYATSEPLGEFDIDDMLEGTAGRLYDGDTYFASQLHGMALGYVEARWGAGRWAPPIRNYGDGGETVNYNAGIKALEDALDVIGYPHNGTGTGVYQTAINVDGLLSDSAPVQAGLHPSGLSHWQRPTYTTIPSYPHDTVYVYDNFATLEAWLDQLEASAQAYPAAANAGATGATPVVTTEGGGNNSATPAAANAQAQGGPEVGNEGLYEWTSIVDGADEAAINAGDYYFDAVDTSGLAFSSVTVDEPSVFGGGGPWPAPGANKWVRHDHGSGGSSSAQVSVSLDNSPAPPSHPGGYYPVVIYGRFYFRFNQLPGANAQIAHLPGAFAPNRGLWELKTDGHLWVKDDQAADSTDLGLLTAGTTYRLEWHYSADGSLGPGPDELETRLYELHSTTPLATSVDDTGADYIRDAEFGPFVTADPGTPWQFWTAEHALQSSQLGWIGPVDLEAGGDDAVTLTAATAAATAHGSATAVTNAATAPSAATAAATAHGTAEAVSEAEATPSSAPATATAGTVTVAAVTDDQAAPSSATAAATAHGSATAVTNDAVTLTAADAVVTATAGTVEAGSDREATPAAAIGSSSATAGNVTAESAGQAAPAAAEATAIAGIVSVTNVSSATVSPPAAIGDADPPPSIDPEVTVDDAVTLTAATSSALGGTTEATAGSNADADPTAATAAATGRPPAVDTDSDAEAAPGGALAAASGQAALVTVDDATTPLAASAAASGAVPAVAASSDNAVTLTAATSSALGEAPTVDTDSDAEARPDTATAAATAGPVTVELEQDAASTLIRALGDAEGGLVTVTVDDAVTPSAASAAATAIAPAVDAGSSSEATPAAAVAIAVALDAAVELIQDAEATPAAAVAVASGGTVVASTILLSILRRFPRPTMHSRNPEPGRS
ncbi:MAG: alpha/beta hydrolase [Phycisphaerales bacterium]